MSLKQENLLFLKTPILLLRVPEFVRLFRCNSFGAFYEIILAHVNRMERSKMKTRFSNHQSYVNKLGDLYEKEDLLAAYFTDEQLAHELMFCDPKSIQNYRKKLIELKLITVKPYKGGYLYIVGKRLRSKRDERTMGNEYEGFYIDSWFTMAIKDKEQGTRKFADYLMKNLGNSRIESFVKKKEERIENRCRKEVRVNEQIVTSAIELNSLISNLSAEQLELEAEAEQTELVFGNYFRESEKLVSKTDDEETAEKERPTQQISEPESAPIEDIDLKLNVDASEQSSEPDFESDVNAGQLYTFAGLNSMQTPVQSFITMLDHYDNPRAAIKGMRKHIAMGAPKGEIERLAYTKLPFLKMFEMHPRFAIELAYQKTKQNEAPVTKLYNALVTLREDVTGSIAGSDSSNEFTQIKSMLKNLIGQYSYDQVSFTIRQLAIGSRNDLVFFCDAGSFKSLPHFVRQFSSKFNEHISARRELEMQRKAQKLREEQALKAKEERENSASQTEELSPEYLEEIRLIREGMERRKAEEARLQAARESARIRIMEGGN